MTVHNLMPSAQHRATSGAGPDLTLRTHLLRWQAPSATQAGRATGCGCRLTPGARGLRYGATSCQDLRHGLQMNRSTVA